MTKPVGNELVAVIGVAGTGGPAATTEYFTTAQIAGAPTTPTSVVRNIGSGSSDTATFADATILWKSATASAKTETIPAPTIYGQTFQIGDNYGNANTYPITITPASGTIDGSATYVINVPWGGITLVADGVSNWKTF